METGFPVGGPWFGLFTLISAPSRSLTALRTSSIGHQRVFLFAVDAIVQVQSHSALVGDRRALATDILEALAARTDVGQGVLQVLGLCRQAFDPSDDVIRGLQGRSAGRLDIDEDLTRIHLGKQLDVLCP